MKGFRTASDVVGQAYRGGVIAQHRPDSRVIRRRTRHKPQTGLRRVLRGLLLHLHAPVFGRETLPCGHMMNEQCVTEMRRGGASGRCDVVQFAGVRSEARAHVSTGRLVEHSSCERSTCAVSLNGQRMRASTKYSCFFHLQRRASMMHDQWHFGCIHRCGLKCHESGLFTQNPFLSHPSRS